MKDTIYKYIQIYKYTYIRIHCTHIHSRVNRYIHLYNISREPNFCLVQKRNLWEENTLSVKVL